MKKFILLFLLIPTICHAASLAEIIEWKYGDCAGTKQVDEKDQSNNPKMIISYWKCSASQPDEKQISIDTQEYDQFLMNQKIQDAQKESDLKTGLKISDEDLDTLARLIKERI